MITAQIHEQLSKVSKRPYAKPTGFTIQNVKKAANGLAEVYKCVGEKRRLKSPKIAFIMAAVCKYFDTKAENVFIVSRKREIVKIRQIFIYLCRKLTALSLKEVAGYLSMDHTTIIHHERVVANRMSVDSEYRILVYEIERFVHGCIEIGIN